MTSSSQRSTIFAFAAGALVVICLWFAYSLGQSSAQPSNAPVLENSVTTLVGGGSSFDEDDDSSTTTAPPPASADQTVTTDGAATTTGEATSVGRFSDLPTIPVAELPSEALDTLDLIAQGGPYPYDKDGTTFQNREGILPDQPRGYYREYTVDTPGSSDRGARRIVGGEDGDLYYTDDHYASFREITW